MLEDDAAPNSISLVVSPEVDSTREVRHRLRAFLRRQNVSPDRVADAELLISELVMNALAQTVSDVDVFARIERNSLRLWVSDGASQSTGRAGADLLEQPDWGLVLVHTLAAQWGVRNRVDGTPGKTVWADFELFEPLVPASSHRWGRRRQGDRRS